jgi:serine/threonine-protein kinase
MLENGMFLIERYEILSKVGVGGMADVYKAKDHVLGRIVAVKVLKAEFSEDVNFVTKFRTEAQSAAGLEHPNIVNIYDVGSENGLHFIVMEYVEGITLKTYIEKKGQLSFKEATSIAIQVARGIETAHNKEIIHRDIKPQNIIISTEGKVKVTDFGIARAISSNTISAEVMGSVHYASPEQARNGFVDGRSDIYSLGIVMYEMVTGRVPFDGDTTVSVAIQHLQEEMVEPSVYAPELPISYEKILLKATQKNPDRRYQTIEELLADLRKALANPEEDFVVIAPAAIAKTRVIGGEELEAIQNSAKNADLEKDEYLIPDVIEQAIKDGTTVAHVIDTNAKWAGVTYKEDKESVISYINEQVKNNKYPNDLWS